MAPRREHDFFVWTNFPSSLKLYNDQPDWWWPGPIGLVTVTPGATLTAKLKAKQENGLGDKRSVMAMHGFDGSVWKPIGLDVVVPRGKLDWSELESTVVAPSGINTVKISPGVGSAAFGLPTTVWFDDLRIYKNGVLIYADDFAKWDPVIGAGIGAGVLGALVPAVVRVPELGVAYEYQKPLLEKEPLWAAGLAGLGALVGGGVGLLTALGLVPVPQIPPLPALEAPPEGARLGTYVIRG